MIFLTLTKAKTSWEITVYVDSLALSTKTI
jgi:hypothetical protein